MFFGPVMVVWFLSLLMIGAYRIYLEPRSLLSFNPWYGIKYLISNGPLSFLVLGAVFLSITGIEELYSDIGHFTTWPIRVGWFFLVMPSLMINYIGQCGTLLQNPDLYVNPFFFSVPTPVYWPMLILSTISTLVASQAVITGSFSIIAQAINLNLFPPITVRQTSDKVAGQIFIPFINYILMVFTLLITFGFGADQNITNAYGFSICTMMIITTCLYSTAIHAYFHQNIIFTCLFLLFLGVESFFWGAVVFKVPQGGWAAILICLFFAFSMLIWVYGEKNLNKALKTLYASNIRTVEELSGEITKSLEKKSSDSGDSYSSHEMRDPVELNIANNIVSAVRAPGVGVFLSSTSTYVPKSFDMFVEKTHAIPDYLIFLRILKKYSPYVKAKRRYKLTKYRGNVYSLIINVGFAEYKLDINGIVDEIMAGLCDEPLPLTFYQYSLSVSVDTRNWFRKMVLMYYSNLKELAKENIGVKIQKNSLIIISFNCLIH